MLTAQSIRILLWFLGQAIIFTDWPDQDKGILFVYIDKDLVAESLK